jgi:hypothetical protein
MKRFLTSALFLGVLSPFGLVGCADKEKATTETKIETPGGTSTITDTKEVKSTGENPPVDVTPAK